MVLNGQIHINTKQKLLLIIYVNQKENTCFKNHLLGKVLAVWISIAGGFSLLAGPFTLDPGDWTMVIGDAARGLVAPAGCVDIKIKVIAYWLVRVVILCWQAYWHDKIWKQECIPVQSYQSNVILFLLFKHFVSKNSFFGARH